MGFHHFKFHQSKWSVIIAIVVKRKSTLSTQLPLNEKKAKIEREGLNVSFSFKTFFQFLFQTLKEKNISILCS